MASIWAIPASRPLPAVCMATCTGDDPLPGGSWPATADPKIPTSVSNSCWTTAPPAFPLSLICPPSRCTTPTTRFPPGRWACPAWPLIRWRTWTCCLKTSPWTRSRYHWFLTTRPIRPYCFPCTWPWPNGAAFPGTSSKAASRTT